MNNVIKFETQENKRRKEFDDTVETMLKPSNLDVIKTQILNELTYYFLDEGMLTILQTDIFSDFKQHLTESASLGGVDDVCEWFADVVTRLIDHFYGPNDFQNVLKDILNKAVNENVQLRMAQGSVVMIENSLFDFGD